MKFVSAFDLKPAFGRLKHLGALGYMTLENVEDPGDSAPGGMGVQDWCIYRANWLGVSKVLPEGGVEGEAAFLKENPTEEYPGDVVYDERMINVYKGAAGAMATASKVSADLNQYPVFDEDILSDLETEAIQGELDSWAMDDAKREFGYKNGWEDNLTDEEAAWLQGLTESDPQTASRVEQGANAIYELSPEDEQKLRRAVEDGLRYGDWTVVHFDEARKVLDQEGAGHVADPAAALHQFLAKEMQAQVPGSAADMAGKEEAGQLRLLESLNSAKTVVAGVREVKRLAASQNLVLKAKSVANIVAKIVGTEPSTEVAGGGLIVYKAGRQLAAALFKAHQDGSFGVSWAPMSMFKDKDKDQAGTLLAAHTMLSFDNTTKLKALSDQIVKLKVRASGDLMDDEEHPFVVYNNYDDMPAFPNSFATVEEALDAANDKMKGWEQQGYYKTNDGLRVPYSSLTVGVAYEGTEAPEDLTLAVIDDRNEGGWVKNEAQVQAKSVAGTIDDIGSATLRAWVKTQGYKVHAGADALCAASRQRLNLWAKTPKGFEPVVKELKHQKGVDNPWAVAWSMKNKGAKVKAADDFSPDDIDELFVGDKVQINYYPSKEDREMGSEPYDGPAVVTRKTAHRYSGEPEYEFSIGGQDDDIMFTLGDVTELLAPGPKRKTERKMVMPDLDRSKLNPEDGWDELAKLGIRSISEVEDYSGRGMMGKPSPFAFTVENASQAQDRKLLDWGLRRDSLGRKTIYYMDRQPSKKRGVKAEAEAGEIVFSYLTDNNRGSREGGEHEFRFYADTPVEPELLARFQKLANDDLRWEPSDNMPGYEATNWFKDKDKKKATDEAQAWGDQLAESLVAALEAEFGAENVDSNVSNYGGEGSVTVKVGS